MPSPGGCHAKKLRSNEILCGSKDEGQWPVKARKLRVSTGREPGRKMERRLIIVTPSSNPREGYVSLFMVPPSDQNIAAVRGACATAARKE